VRGEYGQERWLVDMLESERAVDPDALAIVVAEAGPTVVCAAWIRFERGTEFATFGAARRCRSGAGAGSIAPPSPTGRASLPSAGSATSRPTAPTIAAPSSSVSASPR
jgi:hypothetical protein